MIKEFREFLFKGNLLEIAVAFVTGAATAAFIDSFIKNMITPLVAMVTGGSNFANMFVVIKDGKVAGPYNSLAAATEAGATTLNYGAFLDQLITFVVLMFVVFMIIKASNKFKKAQAAEAPAAPPAQEVLLAEIRDLLKKQA